MEWLEERWCPAGDTYTWNPGIVNLLANNPANWMKNGNQQGANGTLPGTNVDDTVVLDGKKSNGDIEWNQNYSFSTMTIQNSYSGQQTIDKSTTLDLTGHNGNDSMSTSGALFVIWGDATSKLQIDANATINFFTFNLAKNATSGGTLYIDGGTTTIYTGVVNGSCAFWGTLDVSNINEGETPTILEDKGKNPGQTHLEVLWLQRLALLRRAKKSDAQQCKSFTRLNLLVRLP